MKHQRAFTLLEVLIALAMLAIALTASHRGISLAARQASEMGERHLAQWVAQNRLAERRMLPGFPDPGSSGGDVEQGGYKFHWQEDIKTTDNPTFRRVDIKVTNSSGTRMASLVGFVSRD